MTWWGKLTFKLEISLMGRNCLTLHHPTLFSFLLHCALRVLPQWQWSFLSYVSHTFFANLSNEWKRKKEGNHSIWYTAIQRWVFVFTNWINISMQKSIENVVENSTSQVHRTEQKKLSFRPSWVCKQITIPIENLVVSINHINTRWYKGDLISESFSISQEMCQIYNLFSSDR